MDRARINVLMDEVSSGHEAAFGQLAGAVQDELYRLALAHGLRRDDAAEAVQEALLRAYAGRYSWRKGAEVMPWLCGIAVNVVREYYRKARRRKAVSLEVTGYEGGGAAKAEEADDESFSADELDRLQQAVADLPVRQREAVACRYLRRMSIRETAQAMGCAEGTVKSAVFAALETLRRRLR
jgi:RNA polymerase sigma factor (sigma-70 family)